jgi:hypothetical protein
MSVLEPIELATKDFAKKRTKLAEIVTNLNESIIKLNKQALPDIKAAVNATKEAESKLIALLEKNKVLFTKPKTIIMHGIKVGFRKQNGCIEIADEQNTIKLIRKHFPEKSDVLIVQKESVSKEALGNINVDELKKIGCTVIADTDEPMIKATDSNVDKLVTALLKSDKDEVEA